MVTSAKAWKKSQTGELELTVPSGHVCLVRRLRPEAFLSSGLLPDTLSDIVTKAIKSKKGLPPDIVKKMTDDPKQLRQGLKMIDEVLCYVVIEPNVQMPPGCVQAVEIDGQQADKCGEYEDAEQHTNPDHDYYHTCILGSRDEEVLYADEVDLTDKNFIFQFALGGVADAERFREELSSTVADVSNGKAVSKPSKRSTRRK